MQKAIFMVPLERFELPWCCHQWILSPPRLPVPPQRHKLKLLAKIYHNFAHMGINKKPLPSYGKGTRSKTKDIRWC